MLPKLYIVVPCYNEESVLPITSSMFREKIRTLTERGKIDADSRILFVNDGSRDATWKIIQELAREDFCFEGISLSRNRGHQNALLAGLMEAKDQCDITISIDCDGQDDIDAMDRMVDEYLSGAEIVYGVRDNRDTDTFFKRFTAESFYKAMRWMGAETVFNHADYRLVSARVLQEFANFKEVNIFLRGMFPLVGFKSTCVYYTRKARMAGESHYPLSKMLSLAFDGITSLSVKPIRIITTLGILISGVAFALILYALIAHFSGNTVQGWSSSLIATCFIGGIQLISLGVIGEYIGKIYLEVKARPRYIVGERTREKNKQKFDITQNEKGKENG